MVAAAVVGSAVVGAAASSAASSKAAKSAANAQRDAADQASQTQLEMYYQNRADQEPMRDMGLDRLRMLHAMTTTNGELVRPFSISDFEKDPGYEFRMSEGMRGLEGSAAARGGLLSGATLRALTRYNQDFASNEFNNAFNRDNITRGNTFNRLASIAGIGQAATNQIGNYGAQTAQNVGNNQLQAGNARAAGYIGQGNALSNGITQGVNWYQQQNMMNSLNSQPAANNPSYVSDDYRWGGLQ